MLKSKTKLVRLSVILFAIVSPQALADNGSKITGDQLVGYLTGNTIYLDVQPGGPFGKGGLSPFYYGQDGRFAAQLSTGKITGTWQLSNNKNASYCIDMAKTNKTFCTDVIRKDASIEHHSVGLKRLMGPVVKIVPGNKANL